jgi:cytochrome c oxidase subunit 4
MAAPVIGTKAYYGVFGALVVLTLLTVGIAFLDLGPFNPVAALLIAGTKAALVILYFMHVRYETPITRVFAIAGFCWLAILMLLSFSDYYTRGWMRPPGEVPPLFF